MKPQIGLGGGCHWCTEGIFRAVIGVSHVRQGWVSARSPHASFSEAILLEYDPQLIALPELIAIHLHSHSCTNAHSMRVKYRSAVYVFDSKQEMESREAIEMLQADFDKKILTDVMYLQAFELNVDEYLDYYRKNPEKPFCKTYIEPKLRDLMGRYSLLFERAGNSNSERLNPA